MKCDFFSSIIVQEIELNDFDPLFKSGSHDDLNY